MSRRIPDWKKDVIREDYAAGDLSAKEIMAKHGISQRTLYNYTEGIKRKGIPSRSAIQIMLTADELETMILALIETEKIAHGDLNAKLNVLEDKLASKAEELYTRQTVDNV